LQEQSSIQCQKLGKASVGQNTFSEDNRKGGDNSINSISECVLYCCRIDTDVSFNSMV